jgi:leucyl-tRNA synthetase
MYGQTNCFVLPEGDYGVFLMPENELWICSERSMLNMSYQGITLENKKSDLQFRIKGEKLLGLKCKAPLSLYEFVYVWPMLTISMSKGTGVVTSVPSDSPDDYAALVDLKKKPALREKFGLKDFMIMEFEPISIIDVPDYSDMSAVKAYQDFKISSMNDKQKLLDAKQEVYLKGFYKGVMKVGEFKGEKVETAKKLTKDLIIGNK